MLTTKQKIARSIEYLLQIEELFYNARPRYELSEEENTFGDELHTDAKELLLGIKTKALEDCLKELEDEEN